MLLAVMFVAGYGKTVSHVIVGLKSAKETKQLKLDPPIYKWAISKLKNMSLSLKETFTRRRKLSKTSPCTMWTLPMPGLREDKMFFP